MVQRKAASCKSGIQAHHIKSEKQLASLKPSSQYQDGKNNGGTHDLKKKMKKSRSSPLRKGILQPVKLLPLDVPTNSETPQKQPLIKTFDGSPNYMKSTSSSERKERTQVSYRNNQTSSDCKSPSRRKSNHSKLGSASGHKLAKRLTKSNSLKLGRILTKTPSFKPARASAKKCTQVALRADIDVQRATCSSTQKDSKFPGYLMLNHGGTESEGSSVMKVCPYNYCSLNGHRHVPLPPLKCFMSARRRLLKTQKSTKLGALSPGRAKLSGEGTKDIDTGQVIFDGKSGFFVEIFTKERQDVGQVEESVWDEAPHFDIDFEDAVYPNTNIVRQASTEDQKVLVADENFPPSLLQEERTAGGISDGRESVSEISDMDWEEGQVSMDLDSEDSPIESEGDSDRESDYLSEIENPNLNDEPIFKPGDTVNESFDDIPTELQESYLGESTMFGTEVGNHDSESGSKQQENWETDVSIQGLDVDQILSTRDEYGKIMTTEKKDGIAEIDGFMGLTTRSASIQQPVQPTIAREENDGVFEAENEILEALDQQQNELPQDENDNALLGNQITYQDKTEVNCSESVFDGNYLSPEQETPGDDSGAEVEKEDQANATNLLVDIQILDSSPALSAAERDTFTEDNDESRETNEGYRLDANTEENKSSQSSGDESFPAETGDDSFPAETGDDLAFEQLRKSHVNENEVPSDDDQNKAKKFKITTPVDSEGQSGPGPKNTNSVESSIGNIRSVKVEDVPKPLDTNTFLEADITSSDMGNSVFRTGNILSQEVSNACNNSGIRKGCCKRSTEEGGDIRKFNPREPNYLPVDPDPEAEKVDLRHQMVDERKNTEEWMLDYALQQTVTKLAPARKRKVALLVEAFEMVMPIPKFENHPRHTSESFAHVRSIQACS